jgi:hypothetical protein
MSSIAQINDGLELAQKALVITAVGVGGFYAWRVYRNFQGFLEDPLGNAGQGGAKVPDALQNALVTGATETVFAWSEFWNSVKEFQGREPGDQSMAGARDDMQGMDDMGFVGNQVSNIMDIAGAARGIRNNNPGNIRDRQQTGRAFCHLR